MDWDFNQLEAKKSLNRRNFFQISKRNTRNSRQAPTNYVNSLLLLEVVKHLNDLCYTLREDSEHHEEFPSQRVRNEAHEFDVLIRDVALNACGQVELQVGRVQVDLRAVDY